MKFTKIKVFLSVLVVVILVIVGVYFFNNREDTSGKYNTFAECLKDKGAVFYGAFWCPHCQAQKKLFGSSKQYLNYVECSTPDASNQTQICKDKKILGYPTWEFIDGSRINGDATLQMLSDKTGCPLPVVQ